MTNEEHVLWRELRNGSTGTSFRRQSPVLGYVIDFFSPELNLAIEVDGPVHDARAAADNERDVRLGCNGIKVLRFTNDDVINKLTNVVEVIRAEVDCRRNRRGSPLRRPNPAMPSPEGKGRDGERGRTPSA